MPRPKKENTVQREMLSVLSSLSKSVKKIDERLVKLETQEPKKELPRDVPQEPTPQEIQIPVPVEFRHLIDTMLNKNFELRVDYTLTPPAIDFNIIVPERYRTVGPDYIQTYKEENHRGIIPNAEGLNGVRIFVEKVFNSFPLDLQALIVSDRMQL